MEFTRILNEIDECAFGERTRRAAQDHNLANDQQGGDRQEDQQSGEVLLGLSVDFGEDEFSMLLGGLLVDRRERTTWAAPERQKSIRTMSLLATFSSIVPRVNRVVATVSHGFASSMLYTPRGI